MDPVKLMSRYTLALRALYLIHQENHWKTKGYDRHLLFQRIYEGVGESADEAAEKTVGIYGDLVDQEDIAGMIASLATETEDLVERSLEAEEKFQELAANTYTALKDADAITMGVDDMIMAQISKSEVHTYLLGQAK